MERDLATLSMLNPLRVGDLIVLEGPDGSFMWKVVRGGYGWTLKREDNNEVHPTIKDIDGMSDLIEAVLTWAKGYAS